MFTTTRLQTLQKQISPVLLLTTFASALSELVVQRVHDTRHYHQPLNPQHMHIQQPNNKWPERQSVVQDNETVTDQLKMSEPINIHV